MSVKCPFIKVCEKKVDFTTLRVVCTDHSYVSCEEYEKIKKVEMRPREWEELLARG
jgi:hypothetical protein